MAKRRRSGEREVFWRDVVMRFRTSGLSVRAFCRREKLQESAFYFWRRTLADRDGKLPTKPRPTSKRAARPAFLPVTIRSDVSSPTLGLTLELRGGGVLRFSDAVAVERVVALIRALEAAT